MTKSHRVHYEDYQPAISPVLIVDDSKAHRRLLARTLSKWGYDTVEAASGEEALDLCRATSFDIIISDWIMPGMSGVEFCRDFRQQSDRPAFFLLLTAQTDRETMAEGLASGADDFISKPFHAVEMRARLLAGTRIVQAQRALEDKNDKLSNTLEELSEAYALIEKDLKGARAFQHALVPDRHIEFGTTSVSLLFKPSGHVGGDLVGHFPVNEQEICVFSVDVSGHGVASALMTARVASYLSGTDANRNIALRVTDSGPILAPLDVVCAELNQILLEDQDSDQYLTMTIAGINLESGQVKLCQAGHPSPLVQRSNGAIEYRDLWSTPIGLIDEAEFAQDVLKLEKGDRLVLYSDGLTECPDPSERLLDEEGLARIFETRSNKLGLELVDEVLVELVEYCGGDAFPDDVSAAIIQRH